MRRQKLSSSKRYPGWQILLAVSLLFIAQLSFAWHTHDTDSTRLEHCKICAYHQNSHPLTTGITVTAALTNDEVSLIKPISALTIIHTAQARAPPTCNHSHT